MKEFDYVINGGGCAGLSLAYELEINNELKKNTLAIIETREKYKRDKTWSFWKVFNHNFEDCVIKNWNNFTINTSENSHELKNEDYPYQSIDSEKFYTKINSRLSTNPNVSFFKSLNEINSENSLIFNSVFKESADKTKLWQHFQGIEIETSKDIFDEEIINLMDFNCDQKNNVHFFYTLPFNKNRALIETTWLSDLEDQRLMDYDLQLENYIKNNLGIKNYKINFMEKGAIPLFYPSLKNNDKTINIGSAGGMTRLSTGYTFLNIQEHSKYIAKNINKINKIKTFSIGKKYQLLDKIFLKVLEKNPEKMPKIFFDMFKTSSNTIIKFLSNKSNIFEDFSIISKMPKLLFIKAIF
ncbi:MAG: lycopene cyclase family protein [Candidatus Pelagibacter sp.]|tara:strand:- start:1717 stop:2781 length:1065 start_codon:yes stop_codon:yes gene_type:complete